MDRTVSEVGILSLHLKLNCFSLFPAEDGCTNQYESSGRMEITRAIEMAGCQQGPQRALMTEPQVEEKLQKLSASEEDWQIWQQTLEPLSNTWNIVAA